MSTASDQARTPLIFGDRIDYAKIIERHPWLIEESRDCILSPDSDGLLCGLFMSSELGWKIRGYYDGKVVVVDKSVRMEDCVFLDMEIFRPGIKSIGQHMVLYDKRKRPGYWAEATECISANNLRDYDFRTKFSLKYPLATIHLLLSIIGSVRPIKLDTDAICPLLYTDGTFKNLFNYPENCLSWFRFMNADNESSPIHSVFFNDHYSIHELMVALKNFFADLKSLNGGTRGADKLYISDGKGAIRNIDESNGMMLDDEAKKGERFLQLLSDLTGWAYSKDKWSKGPYKIYALKKGTIKPSQARYNDLMRSKPFSLAITSSLALEYSLTPENT